MRYLIVALSVSLATFSLGAPSPAQAFSLTGVAEGVFNPTLDTVESISKWKDAGPEALRREQCNDEQGQWVEKLKISACNNGEVTVDADGVVLTQPCGPGHHEGELELQCTHQDSLGHIYFNDGPSVPPAMLTISGWLDPSIDQLRYNKMFWQAGVAHDHCYHNNPITYGYTKEDCDERFVEDLVATCVFNKTLGHEWFNNDVCHTYAKLMYGMVRSHGAESFEGFNMEAQYEQQEPLFKQYGLDASPYNEACKQETTDFLVKFNIIDDPKKAD